MDDKELTPEEQEALAEIRKKKSLLIQEHRIKKSTAESRPTVPRKFDKDKKFTSERMVRQLSALGLDPMSAINQARSRSVSRRGRKRERSVTSGGDNGDNMDMDVDQPNKRMRSLSRSRSQSRPPGEIVAGEGFKDSAQKTKALKLAKKSMRVRNKDARHVDKSKDKQLKVSLRCEDSLHLLQNCRNFCGFFKSYAAVILLDAI
ncbi:hypothetical protein MRB53_016818 [Persea americana]|uniref:Uncharacterized protein n=1 Tax=Persea americana TaxID=3435 RepID=A0ACC2M478_PERAE|nr:hypothetical protein MRB53_016818 [Persea americana]